MPPGDLDDLAEEVRRRSTGHTELEHLAAAVAMGEELSRRADEVVGHFVEAARQGGCSWAQIGGVLGVTRQAAQQQDSNRRRRPGRGRERPRPFERYTDRMRRVLVLAQGEAERLRHNWIGTEHLLLALAAEGEGVAAHALRDFGVAVDGVRSRVEAIIGTGPADGPEPECEPRPFTPRAKHALDLAVKEAARLSHNYVGTEHALLGVMTEGRGVAAQVLAEMGVDLPALRRRILALLAGPG